MPRKRAQEAVGRVVARRTTQSTSKSKNGLLGPLNAKFQFLDCRCRLVPFWNCNRGNILSDEGILATEQSRRTHARRMHILPRSSSTPATDGGPPSLRMTTA